MTWNDFKDEVAAYLNRPAAELISAGSVDLILSAANKAKTDAQRRRNFKMARDTAFVAASLSGTLLSTAYSIPAATGGALVPVKVVEAAWIYASQGSSYYRARRVPAITTGDLKLYFPTVGNARDWLAQPNVPTWDVASMRWYIRGQSIFLTGAAPQGVGYLMLDVIKWMPDYDGTITDFFLTYHNDYMLAKTLDYLNIYVKDDQRVMISKSRLDDAWTSVCSFDDSYAEDAFDIGEDD